MSLLRNIESKIAGVVEGSFARAFKSQVRPIEIARRLVREMEDHKVQSLARTYVPNEYVVWLSPSDREQFAGYEDDLIQELCGYLLEYVRSERFTLTVSPSVEFRTDDDLRVGEFGIQTRRVSAPTPAAASPSNQGALRGSGAPQPRQPVQPPSRPPAVQPPSVVQPPPTAVPQPPLVSSVAQSPGQVAPGQSLPHPSQIAPPTSDYQNAPNQPVSVPSQHANIPVDTEGQTVKYSPPDVIPERAQTHIRVNGVSRSIFSPTVIGRSRTCDVVIDDPNISRRHAQLEFANGNWVITDLGSTNGVRVNGQRIHGHHPIVAGDTVELGSARVVLFS